MAKEKLSPVLAIIFWIIPILNLILFYYWNKGIKQKWKLNISPGLRTLGLLVPIVNIIIIYFFLSDLNNKAGRTEVPPSWWAILLIVPFVNIIIYLIIAYQVQKALNALNVITL